jgi:hypothetical protein
LTDKSSDLKGQPLKTSLRVMIGGQQCSAAKVKANGSANTDNSAGAAGNPITNVAQAGKAIGSSVGNLVGGMFHKKKTGDEPAAAGAAAPADAATAASASPSTAAAPGGGAADPYAQFMRMATFTTETVTINAEAIPANRFEVPGDWKKEEPKASKQVDEDFTCPKSES